MQQHDPRLSAAPFILTMGGLQVDIRDDNDRRQFSSFLHDNPDMREEVIKAIRSGVSPSEVMNNLLLSEVKRSAAAVAPVANPKLIKDAAESFIAIA